MTSTGFKDPRQELPDDWRIRTAIGSDSFAEEDIEQSVSSRFEKMAATYSGRIAARSRQDEMRYETLNSLANRIAWSVISECTGETTRVALLCKHDIPALAAMIGVLKSGNAYVPIDPSYPPQRIRHILEDSQATLMIAQECTFALAESLAGGRCKALNVDALCANLPDRNPGLHVSPDSIAYIIYTSGSTGTPKGVIQTHRNLLHFISSYSNSLGITMTDRLSLLPSLSFSASLMDIYGALLNGASVHPYNVKEEGYAGLADWLAEEKITVYHSIPTLFRHFTDSLNHDHLFPNLRLIDLGGEPVYRKDVDRFKKHFSGDCVLVNHMAFTEASVAAQYFIDHHSEIAGNLVPAGYQAKGVEISLIDEEGRKIESGEAGEIMIKSKYISPGYWQNPELTSKCFFPGADGTGVRMYRTGDIGRKKENGILEHVGRKDHRVKVRGYSIEPLEVETAILEIASVKEVVVVSRLDRHGDYLLLAYVVLSREKTITANELRAHLKENLPNYMVPARFVFIDALPTTPSGKIDRNALPGPGYEALESGEVLVLPRSPLEIRLTEIWLDILGVRHFGIKDNFFHLGGDSLMATILFVMIEKEYGQKLSPSILYQAPTIEQLAAVLAGTLDPVSTCLVPLRRQGSRPPLFLVSGVGGDAITFRHLVQYIDPEQPIYGVNISANAFNATMDEVVSHYMDEICRIFPAGPFLLGGFSSGGVIAFEIARQLRARHHEVGFLSMLDTVCPTYFRSKLPFWNFSAVGNFVANLPFWFYYRWVAAQEKIPKIRRFFKDIIVPGTGTNSESISVPHNVVQESIRWLRDYAIKPYDGRIVFYRARARLLMVVSGLDKEWEKYSKELDVYTIPGSHLDILKEPYVRVLAEKINVELRKLSEDRKC